MNELVPLLKHTPSVQDPQVLEEITVQREPLIEDLLDSVLDTDGGLRHQLLIGPRGMGKTHLLSLLAGRIREEDRREEIVLAWLDEDPWSIVGYGKLLAAILERVAEELEEPGLASFAEELRGSSERWQEGEEALRRAVGARRLVLLVENLDEVFQRIRPDGQAKLRAFAESWRQLLIIATAPQLFAGVKEQTSPFYGFFTPTHLAELTVESARELMRRVAKLYADEDLLRYLSRDVAAHRIRAIESLAGGHPRIWLLFAGCISVAAIDELVPLFLEALDDLTPYYQARLRELSEQQQELVVLLSDAGGALNNRQLSERSGIAQNQIATIVRQLSERGYVRPARVSEGLSGGDQRMSYWELREPLMRLCLDVKQSRGKPLRMVIEFLRAWYGPRLLDELMRLPPEAELATTYASEAFRTLDEAFDFEALTQGSPEEVLARVDRGLELQPERIELQVARATALVMNERIEEAYEAYTRLLENEDNGVPKAALRAQLTILQGAMGGEPDLEAVKNDLDELQRSEPENPAVAALAGVALSILGLDEEAVEVYSRALRLAPDTPPVLGALGNSLAALGRTEEALAAYRRAVEIEPRNADRRHQLGLALGDAGRSEEALTAFTQAVDLEPGVAQFHLSRARALRDLGRDEEALEALSRAAAMDPDDAPAQQRMCWLFEELGQSEKAIAAGRRAVELAPGNASAQATLGTALGRAGKTEEALAAFTRAAELDPANADHEANRGLALRRLQRNEEAAAAYSKAIAVEPDRAFSYAGLGEALKELGRGEEALEEFERAMEHAPDDPHLILRVGIQLNELERYAQALPLLTRATEAQPDRVRAWAQRGVADFRLGRYEEALVDFTRVAELDPRNALAIGNRGSVLANLGRAEEALDAFAEALAIEPERAALHERRGHVLEEVDRLDEALGAFTRAAELAPEEPGQHNNLANLLRRMGRLDEARAAAEQAIALAPEDFLYRFTLAEIELSAGEADDALKALRAALARWSREQNEDVAAGDTELLTQILWQKVEPGEHRVRLIAEIAAAFEAVEALDELGRGLVASIPATADREVELGRVEDWLSDWRRAASDRDELEIPLALLEATARWKEDGERAHLLALPAEQREILVELLESAGVTSD